jgi:hypothetical protein
LADGGKELCGGRGVRQGQRQFPLRINQVGRRRVVDTVLPLRIRRLRLITGAILRGDAGDLLWRAAQADQGRVKERRVFLQALSAIA